MSPSPGLGAKRLNSDRNLAAVDKKELVGIDLGMNVKNVRPITGRSGSKSFHVTTLKR